MTSYKNLTPDHMHPIRSVGIIGCGVMGGAIALAAHATGADVVVFDLDENTRQLAASAGLGVALTPAAACKGRDLVIIATPVDEISALVPMVKPYLEPDTIVTEIGSVKASTRGIVEALSSPRVSVVPSHPMAGSEHFGFENASPEMLQGCTWLVCADQNDPAASRLAAFVAALGAGRALTCPLDAHDTVVAVVSHFPQLTASLLAATVGSAEQAYANGAFAAAGSGFRDTTRIADSSLTMWAPVIEGNRTMVATLLDELAERAATLAHALRHGEMGAVAELFDEAHRARATWRLSHPEPEATTLKPAEEPATWYDEHTGERAWIDRSFGWETVRTSAEDPKQHVGVSARFLAAALNLPTTPVVSDGPHHKIVAAALREAGADVSERETWTADGLPVNGVVFDQRFIVLT